VSYAHQHVSLTPVYTCFGLLASVSVEVYYWNTLPVALAAARMQEVTLMLLDVVESPIAALGIQVASLLAAGMQSLSD